MDHRDHRRKEPKKIHLINFIRSIFDIEHPARQSTFSGGDARSMSYYYTAQERLYNHSGAMVSRLSQEENESEGPEKWQKEELWPQKLWNLDEKEIDLTEMYDGRRRNKCKEVIIPQEVTTRNNRLDSYIQKNFKVDKPETTLPCILNTNYYKGKLQN